MAAAAGQAGRQRLLPARPDPAQGQQEQGQHRITSYNVCYTKLLRPRAAYALLDTDEMSWEHRRVGYEINETQLQMHDAGLPTRLIARLSFGW